MLRCPDEKHVDTYGDLRDELVDKFNEVKEASTITTIPGGDGSDVDDGIDFCVMGIARIDPLKKQAFEDALRSLGTDRKDSPSVSSRRHSPSKVKDVRVYLEVKRF